MSQDNLQSAKTRRDNGEGMIRRRKDGRYEGRIFDTRLNKQVSVYGKKKSDVSKKLRERKTSILTKQTIATKENVETYMLSWLRTFKYNSLKATTYDKHEQMIRTHIAPAIGKMKMSEVTAYDLQQLFNHLSMTKSYSTLKKVYEVLSPCFKHAMLSGDIDRNPVMAIVLPREKNMAIKTKQIQIYPEEDLKKIEEHMTEWFEKEHLYRQAPLYIFLANTGLRRGELHALEWSDIDFERKFVRVDKSMTRYKRRNPDTLEYEGSYVSEIMEPKTISSTRYVPLNKKAIAMLREIQRRNELMGIQSRYVLCNEKGQHMGNRTFDQMLERICKRCDIKFRGLHALRHTFASKCFKAHIEVKIISDILGHADIKITLNTYIHLMDDQKIMAVELLDDI